MPITFSDDRAVAERYDATEITAGTFTLVGQRPVLGRDFTAADEAPGAAPVAILRHAFWQGRLGGDPQVIGRTVRLDGGPRTVFGVMPAWFSFPQNHDFWLPLVQSPEVGRRDARNTRARAATGPPSCREWPRRRCRRFVRRQSRHPRRTGPRLADRSHHPLHRSDRADEDSGTGMRRSSPAVRCRSTRRRH